MPRVGVAPAVKDTWTGPTPMSWTETVRLFRSAPPRLAARAGGPPPAGGAGHGRGDRGHVDGPRARVGAGGRQQDERSEVEPRERRVAVAGAHRQEVAGRVAGPLLLGGPGLGGRA